jgi:hypothetical protein
MQSRSNGINHFFKYDVKGHAEETVLMIFVVVPLHF